MNGVEEIFDPEVARQFGPVAYVVRSAARADGVEFVTRKSAEFQLGLMTRPADSEVKAHRHPTQYREVVCTSEFILVRRGLVRAEFYSDLGKPLGSCLLSAGDCLLQLSGGHGFTFLQESELLEVKQGPYLAGKDKELITHLAPRSEE